MSAPTVPAGAGIITDWDVSLEIEPGYHSYDIAVFLESPSGTSVQLTNADTGGSAPFTFAYGGGVFGFDDEAASPMPASAASGVTCQPLGLLSAFDGETTAGVWKLIGVDDDIPYQGDTLANWSITVETSSAVPGPVSAGALCALLMSGFLLRYRKQ